jgi:hypothetical protein
MHSVQACDRDIIAGLQKLKAFACSRDGEARWCAADEGLCVEALQHVLLTCIEKGISLGSFAAETLLEALHAASDEFSCASHLEKSLQSDVLP